MINQSQPPNRFPTSLRRSYPSTNFQSIRANPVLLITILFLLSTLLYYHHYIASVLEGRNHDGAMTSFRLMNNGMKNGKVIAIGSIGNQQQNEPFSAQYVRYFKDKVEFRNAATKTKDRTSLDWEVIDEVIYSLQSRDDSSICNALLVREAFASAASLRSNCVRCDFDISIVADEPIYSFLTAEENVKITRMLFDRVDKTQKVTSAIFASRKPSDLLRFATKPFVVFLDADVASNHRAFPESIFDMLHKEYE
jgi:hypothetical protein